MVELDVVEIIERFTRSDDPGGGRVNGEGVYGLNGKTTEDRLGGKFVTEI